MFDIFLVGLATALQNSPPSYCQWLVVLYCVIHLATHTDHKLFREIRLNSGMGGKFQSLHFLYNQVQVINVRRCSSGSISHLPIPFAYKSFSTVPSRPLQHPMTLMSFCAGVRHGLVNVEIHTNLCRHCLCLLRPTQSRPYFS